MKIMYHDSLDDLKWSFIITLAFNYDGKQLRCTEVKYKKVKITKPVIITCEGISFTSN